MGGRTPPSLRSLPRLFVPGAIPQDGPFELPDEELHKLRHVLRLKAGDQIAVLPADGSIWRCELRQKQAAPLGESAVCPVPKRFVRLAAAIPKSDKLDEVIRMGTELGVAEFVLFVSARTVQRWDEKKMGERFRRLNHIAQEAAEVCGRGTLPTIRLASGLQSILKEYPDCIVLNESEKVLNRLEPDLDAPVTLVLGPEGGWDPSESALVAERSVSLGPLVFRVDTAAAAALALVLC